MKTIFIVMLLSSMSFTQINRPLPALCLADELDIHNREISDKRDAETKARLDKIVHDIDLLDKLSAEKDNVSLYKMETLSLQSQLKDEKEARRIEKKIAGIAGLMLFVIGNDTLKNVGLVSLFAYSIW